MRTLRGGCRDSHCNIILAENAGFCSGVKRAFAIAESAAKKHGKAYTLGELVHNNDALRLLREKNVFAVTDVTEIPDGGAVIIRSHGAERSVYEKLHFSGNSANSAGVNRPFYDATCPFVRKIHKIAEGAGDSPVIIAGDKFHPEVKGIAGHVVGACHIVGGAEDLEKLLNFNQTFRHNTLILVAQTTFNEYKWRDCIEIIKKHCTNAKIFDTICNATVERQNRARELSREVAESDGVMLVIGGKHSSNSVKLYEICGSVCKKTFFVENAENLKSPPMGETIRATARGACKIGITAGASVPAEIIKEVHSIMSMEIKDVGNLGVIETTSDGEMDFMAEVDKTLQKIHTGKRVKAYVLGVNNNEILVDLGVKQSGYIPADEIGDTPIKLGDEIECIVTRVNDVDGLVYLSKKRIDAELGFDKITKAYEDGEILEGVVDSVNEGGVIVVCEGQRIFVPASQSTVPKGGDLDTLSKKTVKFKIIEINPQRKRLVGSIKAASRYENDAVKEKFWAEIEVGKQYRGEIKSMESYGVFVDLGGVDGMVHLSELTWARVRHPKEAVSIGDKLDVTVKSYDPERKRISLTAKNPDENPWAKFVDEYSEGMTVTATVVNITPFGAFAQIVPGIDGLIHISQISDKRINNVKEVLKHGQEVEVQITEINADSERVSLSIRALLEPERNETSETEEEAAETEEAAPEAAEAVEEEEATSETVEETPESEEVLEAQEESE